MLRAIFNPVAELASTGLRRFLLSCAFSSVLLPLTSVAEGLYIGGDFAALTYSQSNLSDFNLNSLGLRVGVDVAKYIGVEARYAVGAGEENVFVQGQKIDDDQVKLGIDSLFGVYLLGKYPLSDSFVPYVMVGHSILRIEDLENVERSRTNINGLSFGVGIDSDITESLGFHLEYANYINSGTADLKGFSVGLRYKL